MSVEAGIIVAINSVFQIKLRKKAALLAPSNLASNQVQKLQKMDVYRKPLKQTTLASQKEIRLYQLFAIQYLDNPLSLALTKPKS